MAFYSLINFKMVVGILSLKVLIRQSDSLKYKHRVLKSLKEKIRNKFNVSVAETCMLENQQSSVIGVAMIGSGRKFVNGKLSAVINFLSIYPQLELVGYDMEFV